MNTNKETFKHICCLRNTPEQKLDVFRNQKDGYIRFRLIKTEINNPDAIQVKEFGLSHAEFKKLDTYRLQDEFDPQWELGLKGVPE